MAKIMIGDKPRIFGRFYNSAGTLASPATVRLHVRSPSESVSTYTFATTTTTMTTTTTGAFYQDITPDKEGRWYCYWTGAGTVTAADETSLLVRKVHAR